MKDNVSVLRSFDYSGITLGPGPVKEMLEREKAFYLSIPNNALLHGFRKRAGMPAPDEGLAGWYGSDFFNPFGQFVSGLSRMYAVTGDPACGAKVDELVHEWGKCVAEDGCFFYSDRPNSRHYFYDKMVGGLVDASVYTRNAEALGLLARITDWAEANLSREHPPISEYEESEWYTLSENLYRAWQVTGSIRYRKFAEVWEYPQWWSHFEHARDIFRTSPHADLYHAYSHVNSLCGAAAAYSARRDRGLLDTLENAWVFLRRRQALATGGYGPDERLLNEQALRERLGTTHNSFETQCGSWAVFKLSRYLLSFTGDARYADWVEQLLYNGVLASLPMREDGAVFYYSDYNPAGAWKHNGLPWSCCSGTRAQVVADVADQIWMRTRDAVFVCLFVSSTVHWPRGDADVRITQETAFPEVESTTLTIRTDAPVTFPLHIRRPGWMKGRPAVKVNGEPVVPDLQRNWLRLKRQWHDKDTVTVSLLTPFRKVTYPGLPEEGFPAAVVKGPVAMAFTTSAGNPAKDIGWKNLKKSLLPIGGPLRYRAAGDPRIRCLPFYAVGENERYYVYLDPGNTSTHHAHFALPYEGEWSDFGAIHASRQPGAGVSLEFSGTAVTWRGFSYDDAGQAEVLVDGKIVATVDQYSPRRDEPFTWRSPALAQGRHTLLIRLLPDANPASRDRYINVSGLDVEG